MIRPRTESRPTLIASFVIIVLLTTACSDPHEASGPTPRASAGAAASHAPSATADDHATTKASIAETHPATAPAETKIPEPSWVWAPDDATLAARLAKVMPDLKSRIEIYNPTWPDGVTVFVVAKDGREWSFYAHGATPFVRVEDRLYVADYSKISSGCTIDVYDLSTGQKLWSKELTGLGPIEHSKYRNEVTLELLTDRLVVRSKESAGRYIEAIALADGAPRSHRTLSRE